MASMAVSKTVDVGSIPATPAKKLKKKVQKYLVIWKKSSIFAPEIENKRTLN